MNHWAIEPFSKRREAPVDAYRVAKSIGKERVTDTLTAALDKASVPHVVALSSVGADKADKTGPVVGLHNLEQKLNRLAGLNAVYLHAGYFLENLLPQVGVIQNFGMVAGPLRADLPVGMIATRDIGEAPAELLLKLDFAGKQARELLGQRDLTYSEVASVMFVPRFQAKASAGA